MLSGRIATMGAQFVSLALIGRTLGPSDFGVLQIALIAFVYLGFLGDLGTSVLGTRDRDRVSAPGWVGTYLAARILLASFAIVVALLGSIAIGASARGVTIAAVLSIGLGSSSLSLRWFLQAREQFGRIAAIDIVASLVQLALASILFAWGGGLVFAAAVMASGPVTAAILSLVAVRRSLQRPRFDPAVFDVVRASFPAGVAIFATSFYYSIDSILLGLSRSSEEVGYYGAAYRIVFATLALPTVANAVALPVFSRLLPSPVELSAGLASITDTLLYVALPIAVAVTLTAGVVVEVVFGREFASAAPPLGVLIWTCVTVSANTAFAALVLARRQDRTYMLICLLGGVVNVALNIVAIPTWGVMGAAVTSIVTEVVVLSLIVRTASDVAPGILFRSIRPAILPTITMGIAMWPVRDSIAALPIGAAVWLITSVATGGLRTAHLRLMIDSIRPRVGEGG